MLRFPSGIARRVLVRGSLTFLLLKPTETALADDAEAPGPSRDAAPDAWSAGSDQDRGASDDDAADEPSSPNHSNDQDEAQAPSPEIVPPKLAEFVPAEYTPSALEAKVEGAVVLRLTVDEGGLVVAVGVDVGLGHGLDEAASEAAQRLRFAPALLGGKPHAAEILYEYVFELPEESGQGADPVGVATREASSVETDASAPDVAESEFPVPQEEEVIVVGLSVGERKQRSAEAVTVVDVERFKRESADTGEVLARTRGVTVRRAGGLGTQTRLSLGGFDEDQIRFFLNGIPLEYSGYPFGIANVPLNLSERMEIYQGVLPVRFGGDALGGAVNLVTDRQTTGTHGTASYQAGSFETHRASGTVRHRDGLTGLFVAAEGFYDVTSNNYPVDVFVTDDNGQQSSATVVRFHDAYEARGASVEAGLVDQPWAKKLLVRGFFTEYQKEIQHNIVMTVPYGEAAYGGRSGGATIRYAHSFGSGVSGEVVLGATHTKTDFVDLADCIYDWFGQCVRPRRTLGEIGEHPSDLTIWDNVGFARAHLTFVPRESHALRFTSAPTVFKRSGDERLQLDPEARDPLTAKRTMVTVISGVEYEVDVLADKLENIVIAKNYAQFQRTEEHTSASIFVERKVDTVEWGVGDAFRYKLNDVSALKASYEWATRLPRPDETFGNGVLIVPNLELVPERSHNINLGFLLYDFKTDLGQFDASLGGFLREADRLIVLLGSDRSFSYQNVYAARSLGVESALAWTSPREHVEIAGNFTYQDFRNRAKEGAFANFRGDRIPNQPYLFGNASIRFQKRHVAAPQDRVALTWYSRYVHEFFRAWESVGLKEYKDTVDSQLFHTIALSYLLEGSPLALSFSSELHNVTNAKTYDFVGAQKPGRAVYFKTTAEF